MPHRVFQGNSLNNQISKELDSEQGWTSRMIVTTILLAMVLEAVALGAAMIAIALPSILEVFPTDQGGWLMSSYLLAGAVAAPLLGKCADLYGKKRVLIVTMSLSGFGTVICALAPSFAVLLVGRTLQGLVLATLALTYSLIRDIFPPKPAAFAASITVTGMGAFGLVTPLLIGFLLANFGFRGLFWFDAVWTIGLCILIAVIVPESALRRRDVRPDVVGGALLSLGVLGVLLYVSLGRSLGLTSAGAIGLLLAGFALLAIFFLHARRVSEPIVNLRLFTRRPVLFVVVFGAVGYALSATIGQVIPLLAMTSREDGGTYGLGFSTVEYAGIETPRALASVAVGILLGFLVARGRSPRMFMYLGMVCWPLAALSLVWYNDSQAGLILGAVIAGLGGGMVNASLPNVVMQATPAEEQGSTAGTVQLCQTGLGAVAPILMFALLAPHAALSSTGGVVYAEAGFRTWLLLVIAVAVILLVLGATVLRPRASELLGVQVADGLGPGNPVVAADIDDAGRIVPDDRVSEQIDSATAGADMASAAQADPAGVGPPASNANPPSGNRSPAT